MLTQSSWSARYIQGEEYFKSTAYLEPIFILSNSMEIAVIEKSTDIGLG